MTEDNIVLENYIKRMTNKGMQIGTANVTLPALRQGVSHRAWIQNVAKNLFYEIEEDEGTPVRARIEWGRWCVCCPNCGAGYEDVSKFERIFFCFSCGWENKIHPVEFPENMIEIESVLLKRIRVRHRNWTDESLVELRRENIQHAEAV